MSWVDEYKKALGDIQTRTGTGSGSSSKSNSSSSSESSSSSWVNEYRNALNKYNSGITYYRTTGNKPRQAFGSLAPTYASYKPTSQITSRMTVGKKKKDEDEDKKWYEKGYFEDGWDFGDITKTILGVPEKRELKTFEAPDTTDSLEVLKQKSDYYKSRNWNNSEQLAEANKYTQQYNQKALAEYSEKLSKTKMDGQDHTVLEEIELLANMKSGKEKDQRKDAVLKKMESLGMDSEFYPHFAGDGEFNWSDFGNWIKSSASAGLGSFNKMVTDTADVLIGAPLKEMGWENNPVSKLNEYYTNAYENLKYNQQLYAEKLGGGSWDFAGSAVEGTAGAVPAAILAVMTAGTSLVGTSGSLATNAAYQTGNVLTKAGITAETMMKNPQFWTSFAQSLGPKFKEAKEKGVNDSVAAVGSVLSSMLTSGIEIGLDGGSGIQGLPSDLLEEGGSKWWKWLESVFEEGGEEGLQKLVDEGVSKFVFGLEDDYLNPIEYGKDMALGTIAGLALGGGQVASQSTVNALQEHNAKKQTQTEHPLVNQEIETEDLPIVEQEIQPEVEKVNPVADETKVDYPEQKPNITETATGQVDGETYFTMSYEQDGKVVGTVQYGEFEGKPNVKMIEVDPEYRRQGIGTKLLQELQKKYPDIEIDFGMSTEDGSKLLESATYSVENTEVTQKTARIEEIKQKLAEYDKGIEEFIENDMDVPEDYAADYNELYDEMTALEEEIQGKKPTTTFVKTEETQTPVEEITPAPTVSNTENIAPVGNPVEVAADNSELTTPAPSFPERAELEVLKDERKVLEDTLMSMVTVNKTGEKFQELSKKWTEINTKIEAIENNLTDGEGSTGEIAPTEARTDAPYFVSEDVASIVDKMVAQDTEAGEGSFADPYVVYSVDDYVIQRRISRDGQKYSYTIISPDGAFRRGLVEQDIGSFYADVADKLTSLKMEAGGFYETESVVDDNTIATENTTIEDIAPVDKAVPVEAPVRVVASEDGGSLETDKNGFDKDGYVVQNRKHKYRATAESTKSFVMTERVPTQKSDTKTSEKTEQPKTSDTLDVDTSKKGKLSPIKMVEEYFMDNGFVFEKIAKKFKNGAKRSLEAKWNFNRYSRGMAQYLIGHGSKADGVQSLKSIADKVDKAGLTEDFYNYMYNWLNFDRMSVEERYPNSTNRGVFGNAVSAEESLAIVTEYEQAHPEFKEWADEVYAYNRHLRSMLVDGGIISQKTADLWEDMFPHYVPIRRFGVEEDVEVQQDSKHVGFETPVYEFEGSNKRIRPMFDTMAERTLLTFNAVNMNDFGVELYDTLYPGRSTKNTSLDPTRSNVGMKIEDLDSFFDPQAELLQSGENGKNPTFSIFLDGERHTFDITNEMYEAMKPANDLLNLKVPGLSQFSDIRRQLITEYNPWFLLKNAIKDSQDVLMNSQHPLATYATLPKAMAELWSKGQYYQEYMANGGNQNSYFDSKSGSLMGEQKAIDKVKKVFGLDAISKANNFIETVPRLAEYIASRKAGRSIQVSMLDAARVTTNFAAGGQATKFLNRNGATFLNASVQGAIQFGRNIVEAKQNGLKGWVSLAARWTAAGFVPVVLNHLMWDDDEDYQELPDYIRQNYYVVAKYGDGQFLRLPKGRVAAVLQEAVEQLDNATAENGKVDWDALYNIFMENIAPNNAATDNVFAPIGQVIKGKTWYGEDIEPYRLRVTHDENGNEMEVPVTQRYDEKTSDPSIWLSEQLQDIPLTKWMDLSPKEIHYLMDQYSGIIGDTFLPMFTPKAESPIDNKAMKLLAPLRDIFTTDSVLNSRVTGDFYDTLEAAEAKAESEDATPEDKFKSGMLIGYNAEISDLMKEQRKIQTSDMPDSEKYKLTREIKKEINALQEKGLAALEDYSIDGNYAESGDKRYNYDAEDDTWWEVKPKLADGRDNWYYTEEQMFHDNLGVSYSDYWNGRLNPEDYDVKTLYDERNGKRYNFDMEKNAWFEIAPKLPDGKDNYYYYQEQRITKDLGISYEEYWNNREMYDDFYYVAGGYDKESSADDTIETARAVFGYERFAEYANVLKEIKADKDKNGEPIKSSRYPKVQAYVNSLDIPDIEKKILYTMQYPNYKKYKREIVKYLDKNNDISYSSYEKILDELGYKIDSKGYVTW